MNPAEHVQRPPGNSVSDTLDGISEVLSRGDESHADQEECHTQSVVEAEHEIIDPGRIMLGEDGLQRLHDAVQHVDVVRRERGGALPR